jgi:hypothetical protein
MSSFTMSLTPELVLRNKILPTRTKKNQLVESIWVSPPNLSNDVVSIVVIIQKRGEMKPFLILSDDSPFPVVSYQATGPI